MKPSLLVKIFVVLALLAAGTVYFVSSMKPVATIAKTKRHVAVRSVPGTLQVVAEREMSVRSDLHGRVIQSKLELGATVQEGDVLMSLDLGDLEIQIEKLQIEMEAANLILEQGSNRRFSLITQQERLEDVKRRHEAGDASKSEVEARERDIVSTELAIEAEINAKEVRIAQLKNELKLLERQREKMSIRAPMDGVITEVLAYRGDLISGGQEVARMISLDRIVKVKVSEENFSGIELGQIARVKFLGYGESTFSATVSKTLPVADPVTQRYTVHLDVDIDREKLFPGLTGEATITLDERDQALIIPGTAIIGDRVFVVEDGLVSMREIEKGFGSLTNVEILSGLEEGDQVIVEDLDLFKIGDRVRTTEMIF
ncbi:efflux RND transporter periplasmic adaptor subunit [Pelagicoccus sp. NFK12]|uniref:Efflux RND transporter periplasmic adaptor subunit n=2 Tax=Pelagicoccus enzymogenes TaxID=2773457 RepID=A0A927F7R1_9BACT|nr:efflux RND transporter periplasmic adaptor subunit [Pelagicoccus enzymogenes]MBD5779500.1 efflux RND transporter periplasmic adaptor subunit [Pelagicoccus enzymogenes]MDQ8201013.1 efflux RND transporter periplasmic adaptor subunit [Pelagicoccus enzymogenes]